MKVEKKFYTNLAVLRIYLSFLVVSSHCFKPKPEITKKILVKIIYNAIHVPTFYLLSFYFSYNFFITKNIKKIKIRFQRLLIPYFVWPIIIWLTNNLLSFSYDKIHIISFKNLILQLLTGHYFVTVLWFQYNLIFVTLMIIIIHLLFKRELVFYFLFNLMILGFFLQYSNNNFTLFFKCEYIIKYTFGRFLEIITYCITGYIFSSLNIIHILSKNIIISINIFLSILIFNLQYTIFTKIDGFGYQGFKLYTSSISIFLIFSLIPSEKFLNKFIIKFIQFISIYTPGIYFIHKSLYQYLCIFSILKNNALSSVIIIYFISYFISLFGKLIFRKTKLINLFQ